jgi:carboxymethylenebutenolidase
MTTLILLSLALSTPQSCCDMNAFVADPAFVAKHPSPRPFQFKATVGKNVTFRDADGKAAKGFFVPAKKGTKAAVIMVHEWWGLNDYIRKEAESLRNQTGYAVLAVDLYEGKVATQPQDAGKLMAAVNQARGRAIVSGAVTDLKRGDLGFKAAKIGTIGYCFGGGWSHQTAIEGGKNVEACVIYYGMPDMDPARLAKLRAPVLMIYGTQDKWISPDVAKRFQSAMAAAKKPLTVKGYDADHAFANPSNPKFNKKAREDANRETIAFYRRHLGK